MDFFEICDSRHIMYDHLTPYTNSNQSTWARDLIGTFEKLKQWEITNVGTQQFSKAFEMLQLQLEVQENAQKKTLARPTEAFRQKL